MKKFVSRSTALAISVALAFAGTNVSYAMPLPAASSNLMVAAQGFAPQIKAPASRTVTVDGVVLNQQEARLVKLVNQHRANHGLSALRVDQKLVNQSRSWSKVQSNKNVMYHSHYNVGENVAYNNYDYSADEFFKEWKNSPGHNRVMLTPHITKIGYGYKIENTQGFHYATMQVL